ncbi:MAG: hypothetical protein CV087_05490 [Candidatus Brocadia sp. WS118]|nr:MAG: hypothetical protein CV087_05490 [Candidatus Brocadia sp. WS118]
MQGVTGKDSRSIPHSSGSPQKVYGVDFSGAANAGKKIWITGGIREKDRLHIQSCLRASELPGSGNERNRCMAALLAFIRKEKTGAFGFDFPFGLPRDLVKGDSWRDFVVSFSFRYTSAEDFRKALCIAAGGSELKRMTDRACQTPFSPYNLRLYRQTYYGISEVLAPLVRKRQACVLPMQKALPDRPWLLEVCPASTLKQEQLYVPYKGRTRAHYTARKRILKWIEGPCDISLPRAIRLTALGDSDGDALDSVVAAFATFRALRDQAVTAVFDKKTYQLEGYVYV